MLVRLVVVTQRVRGAGNDRGPLCHQGAAMMGAEVQRLWRVVSSKDQGNTGCCNRALNV